MNRRHFVLSSAAAGLAGHAYGANDRVRVAVVGVRGQGGSHLQAYGRIPGVEIAAICDIDESVLDNRIAQVQKSAGTKPERYTDIRKLLENKEIDAISIATPNHNHTLQAIWSLQAGIVLVALGTGFWFARANVFPEVAEGFYVLGVIAMALGVGFAVSAVASYFISTRLGLFSPSRPTIDG